MGYIRWVIVVMLRICYLITTKGRREFFSVRQRRMTKLQKHGLTFFEARRVIYGLWIDERLREFNNAEIPTMRGPHIDDDIVRKVNEMEPKNLAQRVALESTLQEQRNRRGNININVQVPQGDRRLAGGQVERLLDEYEQKQGRRYRR